MAEVLHVFDTVLIDDGVAYRAQAVGRLADDRMWEGWIEFASDRSDVLITGVESRQPAREHLVYWATGLTPVYLEGALGRARDPLTVSVRVREEAMSDAPAPRPVRVAAPPGPAAVLNPFEIGARSIDILDQELRALHRPRLLNIIEAYALNPGRQDIAWMSEAQLVRFICVAVETQLLERETARPPR